MFGSRGNEPGVELLGDDRRTGDANGSQNALSSRKRSWRGLWIAAALLAAIGGGALFTRGDDGGHDEPADDDGTAAPTAAPPTSSMAQVGASTEDQGPAGSMVLAAPTDVAELDLAGELYVWRGSTFYRLDLTTGEWWVAEHDLWFHADWSGQLAGTATGMVGATINGTARSFDRDGETLDEIVIGVGSASIASSGGRIAILDYEFGVDSAFRVHTLDESGRFVELPAPSPNPRLISATPIVGANGRFFVSVVSGGIFEVSAPGFPLVADGRVIAAGDDVGLLRLGCGDSLDDCEVDLLPIDDLDQPQTLQDNAFDVHTLMGRTAVWSPDLTFLVRPWAGNIVTRNGDLARQLPDHSRTTGLSRSVAWSPDSRWLAVHDDGIITFYDPRSERRVAVETPWSHEARDDVQPGLAFSP